MRARAYTHITSHHISLPVTPYNICIFYSLRTTRCTAAVLLRDA